MNRGGGRLKNFNKLRLCIGKPLYILVPFTILLYQQSTFLAKFNLITHCLAIICVAPNKRSSNFVFCFQVVLVLLDFHFCFIPLRCTFKKKSLTFRCRFVMIFPSFSFAESFGIASIERSLSSVFKWPLPFQSISSFQKLSSLEKRSLYGFLYVFISKSLQLALKQYSTYSQLLAILWAQCLVLVAAGVVDLLELGFASTPQLVPALAPRPNFAPVFVLAAFELLVNAAHGITNWFLPAFRQQSRTPLVYYFYCSGLYFGPTSVWESRPARTQPLLRKCAYLITECAKHP